MQAERGKSTAGKENLKYLRLARTVLLDKNVYSRNTCTTSVNRMYILGRGTRRRARRSPRRIRLFFVANCEHKPSGRGGWIWKNRVIIEQPRTAPWLENSFVEARKKERKKERKEERKKGWKVLCKVGERLERNIGDGTNHGARYVGFLVRLGKADPRAQSGHRRIRSNGCSQ